MELKVRNLNKSKVFQLVGSLDIYTASKVKKEITQIIDDEEVEEVEEDDEDEEVEDEEEVEEEIF